MARASESPAARGASASSCSDESQCGSRPGDPRDGYLDVLRGVWVDSQTKSSDDEMSPNSHSDTFTFSLDSSPVRRCPICDSLCQHLPAPPDEVPYGPEDVFHDPEEERDPIRSGVLQGLHRPMPELWRSILRTDALCAGEPRPTAEGAFFRLRSAWVKTCRDM